MPIGFIKLGCNFQSRQKVQAQTNLHPRQLAMPFHLQHYGTHQCYERE